MDVCDPAEEVHELREGQLGHSITVPHRVDDRHDWFSEDNADHGFRHIKLALLSQLSDLVQIHSLLLFMGKVLEGSLEDALISV